MQWLMTPSRKAMSVPCRIGAYMSATDAERVKRGSTTISFAPRLALASVTHLKPHGCASAALPPMITSRSVFRMSVHELVIAPRPNVGPRLDTVGPCQTRAWLSNTTMPVLRTTLYVQNAVSLVVAE